MRPRILIFSLIAVMIVLVVSNLVFAQDIIVPPWYNDVFGTGFVQSVLAVVAVAQYVKNMAKLKGWPALILAIAVGFGYSFFAFYNDKGLSYALGVGAAVALAAVLSYKASTMVGLGLEKLKTKFL